MTLYVVPGTAASPLGWRSIRTGPVTFGRRGAGSRHAPPSAGRGPVTGSRARTVGARSSSGALAKAPGARRPGALPAAGSLGTTVAIRASAGQSLPWPYRRLSLSETIARAASSEGPWLCVHDHPLGMTTFLAVRSTMKWCLAEVCTRFACSGRHFWGVDGPRWRELRCRLEGGPKNGSSHRIAELHDN